MSLVRASCLFVKRPCAWTTSHADVSSFVWCLFCIQASSTSFYLDVVSLVDILPLWCRPRRREGSALEALSTGPHHISVLPGMNNSQDGRLNELHACNIKDEAIVLEDFEFVSEVATCRSSLISSQAVMDDASIRDVLDETLRYQLYCRAFYLLDDNLSGTLELDKIQRLGKFMLGADWDDMLATRFMSRANLDKSGALSIKEFSEFCETILLQHGIKAVSYIDQMIKGLLSLVKLQHEYTKALWQQRACMLDRFARLTVPILFFVFSFSVYAWKRDQL